MMKFIRSAAIVIAVTNVLGCAKKDNQPTLLVSQMVHDTIRPDLIPGMPATCCNSADKAAILQAVRNANISDDEFSKVINEYDDQPNIGSGVRGRIRPHHDSHILQLGHGRLLALIFVQSQGSGHPAHVGDNYWIATKFNNDPAWSSVMVNLGSNRVVKVPLTTRGQPKEHDKPFAHWIAGYGPTNLLYSTSKAWVSCNDGDCCCEGSQCTYAFLALSADSAAIRADSTDH